MSRSWWQAEPEEQGIRVSLATRLRSGCTIRGKESVMFEVLVNLLKNSVAALPKGGDIKIETEVGGERVILRITDTGIGISKENLNRLFTPFYTTSAEPGRGLGLATCRRIVEAHEGTILVDSVEGKGATFTITLPFVKPDIGPSDVGYDNDQGKPLTILAVDDMEATVKMLRAALMRFGHTVLTAMSGEEALRIFRENVIDLVVCDLGMPGMSGWRVGKAIKEISKERGSPKPPFIILTGWDDRGHDEAKCVESGVDAVVQKPLEMTKLVQIIREVHGAVTTVG